MKITEIYIKNFGKLRGVKLAPADGMNIIFGENEAGKSTVMAFILAMLYGLGKGEQRKRYEPWGGGVMDGTISFEHEGANYTLHRKFGETRAADKIELWSVDTELQINLPERAEPGKHILGVNRESFINSVYVGQAGTAVLGSNSEIIAKLSNLASSGEEAVSKDLVRERLQKAANRLRSPDGDSVISSLEKERLSLIDERSSIKEAIAESDKLRADIELLSHKKERLLFENNETAVKRTMSEELRQVKKCGDILKKSESLEKDRKEYEELKSFMNNPKCPITDELLNGCRSLFESYNEQKANVKSMQEQIAVCDSRLDSIDRSCLTFEKVTKKYSHEIHNGLEEYEDLRVQYEDVERAAEEEAAAKQESILSPKNILIAGGALVVLFILIGFAAHVFFTFAAILAAILGVYIYFQKKNISFDGMPRENIELLNIESDMDSVADSMRNILDPLECDTMDDLDRLVKNIDDVNDQIKQAEDERNRLTDDIARQNSKMKDTLERLCETLTPFRKPKNGSEALAIINKLDKACRRYEVLGEKLAPEEELLQVMLDGRTTDDVKTELEALGAKVSGYKLKQETAEWLMSDSFDADLKKTEAELKETADALNAKEKELAAQHITNRELSEVNGKIRALSEKIDELDFDYSAICEAIDALDEAYDVMHDDFGPMINFRTGSILSGLTRGKYSSVSVSTDDLSPCVGTADGEMRGWEALSSATYDQTYLALRLAISGVLTAEHMPLMLDDSLSQFDDRRLKDALCYLAKESGSESIGQVLLFTCHSKIKSLAAEAGITNPVINL